MDEHALRVLEFDKVLARLAGLTSFSAAHDLALALRPSASYRDALERQETLAEALRLREMRTPISFAGAVDVRQALEKASLDGQLDGQELLAVAATQRVAQQARNALTRLAASLPRLGFLGGRLIEDQHVIDEIGAALDQRGEVVDSASQALGVIRRDIKSSHDRLLQRLQDFLTSQAGKLVAQESIVTLRDGRYVVPIKADFRGEVRGIVHDVSSSGATLFIEPLAVVDLANQWRELQIEEQREVERILRRLSALVGEHAQSVTTNVECLAELDLVLASARLAEEIRPQGMTVLPSADAEASPETWLLEAPAVLELVDARHPLLTSPVPISLRVGGDGSVLLVTGPNTGGKTVALKTVGLLCLMAQAGLPVPASAGSTLPVFEEVLADIGDEQSIEQSLSTFSGHLRNVIALLERAGPKSLVLLDELAAGTDPAEGAALARALLQDLLQRGSLTVATTHHGELKLFAHAEPGVVNAAVEFDSATLAPTYRVIMGVPGRSNALAIAARLGLPESILRAAQESLAPEEAVLDSLLSDLHAEREAAVTERQAGEQARRRAEQARGQIEERLAGIDEERARRLDEAALALEEEVEAARAALQRAQRAAQRQPAPAALEQIVEANAAIDEAAGTARRLRRRSRRRRRDGLRPEQIVAGAEVWVQGIPMAAEALSSPDARGEVDVSFGGLRARVGVGQIVRVEKAAVAPAAQRSVSLPSAPSWAPEQIEVRGQTLDEALPAIEKFLDDGFRAGVPRLRVVHGKGTGKMRNAVRQMLAKHPLVKGFDYAESRDGGEGVTVVDMAQ
ncbi:MAG TPA: endonuclease MutS2 [Dehalococcoidia bacterium]|nr:endonuclease MutS2 [Dehalococcoidia bacterium]